MNSTTGIPAGSGNITDAVRAAHLGDRSMLVDTIWKAPGEFEVRVAGPVGDFIAANPGVEETRLTATLGAQVKVADVRREDGTSIVTLHIPRARLDAEQHERCATTVRAEPSAVVALDDVTETAEAMSEFKPVYDIPRRSGLDTEAETEAEAG